MDAQGAQHVDVIGAVFLINVIDAVNQRVVELPTHQHPEGSPPREYVTLRRAFLTYG